MNDSLRQVYVGLDGPDGIVIQTTMATYRVYYRYLGYQLLDEPKMLPGFASEKREAVGVNDGLWKRES